MAREEDAISNTGDEIREHLPKACIVTGRTSHCQHNQCHRAVTKKSSRMCSQSDLALHAPAHMQIIRRFVRECRIAWQGEAKLAVNSKQRDLVDEVKSRTDGSAEECHSRNSDLSAECLPPSPPISLSVRRTGCRMIRSSLSRCISQPITSIFGFQARRSISRTLERYSNCLSMRIYVHMCKGRGTSRSARSAIARRLKRPEKKPLYLV